MGNITAENSIVTRVLFHPATLISAALIAVGYAAFEMHAHTGIGAIDSWIADREQGRVDFMEKLDKDFPVK